jgi:hypothetical protein
MRRLLVFVVLLSLLLATDAQKSRKNRDVGEDVISREEKGEAPTKEDFPVRTGVARPFQGRAVSERRVGRDEEAEIPQRKNSLSKDNKASLSSRQIDAADQDTEARETSKQQLLSKRSVEDKDASVRASMQEFQEMM